VKYIEKLKNMNTDELSAFIAGTIVATVVETTYRITGKYLPEEDYMQRLEYAKKETEQILESEVEE
jgi:hypothetical protein